MPRHNFGDYDWIRRFWQTKLAVLYSFTIFLPRFYVLHFIVVTIVKRPQIQNGKRRCTFSVDSKYSFGSDYVCRVFSLISTFPANARLQVRIIPQCRNTFNQGFFRSPYHLKGPCFCANQHCWRRRQWPCFEHFHYFRSLRTGPIPGRERRFYQQTGDKSGLYVAALILLYVAADLVWSVLRNVWSYQK